MCIHTHTHTHTHTRTHTHMPFPPPGNLPDPGIEPVSPVRAGRFFTTEPLGKPLKPGLRIKRNGKDHSLFVLSL